MEGWRFTRRWLVSLVMFLSGSACGGDDTGGEFDGAVLADRFGEAAQEAYEDAGGDRQEDFATGAVLNGCFVLDGDAATAIVEALGVDNPEGAELSDRPFISGRPDQQETVSCVIRLADRDQRVTVTAGTVTFSDGDDMREEVRQNTEQDVEIDEIVGVALGLGDDNVVAFSSGGGGATYFWVNSGFSVGLAVDLAVADEAAGFQALPVVVDAVTSSLDRS